jgi:acyl-CoA thioester hydrolase
MGRASGEGRSRMSYEKSFTVRWSECDMNGHARNTAYLEYCIDVRLSYLAERGFGWEEFRRLGFGPIMFREEIDYLREVRLLEEIRVNYQQLGLSPDGSRFRVSHELFRADGQQAARLVVSGGWLDLRTRKLVVPPEQVASIMRAIPRSPEWEELRPLRGES